MFTMLQDVFSQISQYTLQSSLTKQSHSTVMISAKLLELFNITHEKIILEFPLTYLEIGSCISSNCLENYVKIVLIRKKIEYQMYNMLQKIYI